MSNIIPLPAPQSAANEPAPQPPEGPVAAAKATRKPAAPEPQSNQRLEIQETEQVGVFVYTVIDRDTGRVLTQIPRETVAQLAQERTYSTGRVIKTTA